MDRIGKPSHRFMKIKEHFTLLAILKLGLAGIGMLLAVVYQNKLMSIVPVPEAHQQKFFETLMFVSASVSLSTLCLVSVGMNVINRLADKPENVTANQKREAFSLLEKRGWQIYYYVSASFLPSKFIADSKPLSEDEKGAIRLLEDEGYIIVNEQQFPIGTTIKRHSSSEIADLKRSSFRVVPNKD